MNSDTFDGLVAGVLLGISLTIGTLYVIARVIDNERRRPSKGQQQKRVEL